MSGTTDVSDASALRHAHDFGSVAGTHEAKARWVVGLTFAMMIGELVVGYATNSLALTADGWHMATHAGALGLSAAAYWYARTRAHVRAFSFGTGKVHALAGYTSAIVLAVVALAMVVESLRRLWAPEVIAFAEALPVAVLGLIVNLASVKLLHHDHAHDDHAHDDHAHAHDDHAHAHAHDDHARDDHAHAHDFHAHAHDDHAHAHDHAHGGAHRPGALDHNLRAAYFHVLADALTSVLAILALLGGRYLGWTILDALMGAVGGLVIARWSWGLCRGAGRQLLDVVPSEALVARLQRRLEAEAGTEVLDLHVWEVGPGALACIASITTRSPLPASEYHAMLRGVAPLAHVSVEVHPARA